MDPDQGGGTGGGSGGTGLKIESDEVQQIVMQQQLQQQEQQHSLNGRDGQFGGGGRGGQIIIGHGNAHREEPNDTMMSSSRMMTYRDNHYDMGGRGAAVAAEAAADGGGSASKTASVGMVPQVPATEPTDDTTRMINEALGRYSYASSNDRDGEDGDEKGAIGAAAAASASNDRSDLTMDELLSLKHGTFRSKGVKYNVDLLPQEAVGVVAPSAAEPAATSGRARARSRTRNKRQLEAMAIDDDSSEGGGGGDELSGQRKRPPRKIAAAKNDTTSSSPARGRSRSRRAKSASQSKESSQSKKTPSKQNPYADRPRRESPRFSTKNQCGKCDACMVDECGECIYCLDMRRFGGKWTKRQKCMNRPPCDVVSKAKARTVTRSSSTLPSAKAVDSEPTSRRRKRTAVASYSETLLAAAAEEPQPSMKRGARQAATVTVKATLNGETPWSGDREAIIPNPAIRPSQRRPTCMHEPGSVELEKLPPAENFNLSELPNTRQCEWSFEESSRVLLAKFNVKSSGGGADGGLHPDDKQFLLKMMERDDITVISEGLVDGLNPRIWDLRFVAGLAGDEPYHKVRRFTRQVVEESELSAASSSSSSSAAAGGGPQDETKKYYVTFKEEDKCVSMKVADYVTYLNKRAAALDAISAERKESGTHPINPKNPEDDRIGRQNQDQEEPSSEEFTFVKHDGKDHTINVIDEVLYLIDYDMVKLLPRLYDDFIKKFKIPDCLPGGKHCMMNSVNVGGRPFMGPNFYVTPPASFTHFHQDGHGTVDSGHQCLAGYNEVIMLRRMPEEHKHRALHILNGRDRRKDQAASKYDALYGLPHGDGLGAKPTWPDHEAIQKCNDMNYYPSVFILKPGQFVHINKGRLHAFRKLSPAALPAFDCHSTLRSRLIREENLGTDELICVSVAWDWMFKGVTEAGINNELVSTLECARLNRQHHTQSLAIPETSVLHMARQFVSEYEREADNNNLDDVKRGPILSYLPDTTSRQAAGMHSDDNEPAPRTVDVLKGIAPSLEFIVNRHSRAFEAAKQHHAMQTDDSRASVSLAKKPNTWENPESFPLDPYGDGDFFCKICGEELSNCYMHCDGCEVLLSKDFNICVSCHAEGKHETFFQMHPIKTQKNSAVNHLGGTKRDRKRILGGCPCHNGKPCKRCGYCEGCSCRCHRSFTMHERFMSIEDEKALRGRMRRAVGVRSDPILMALDERERASGGVEEEVIGVTAEPEVEKDQAAIETNEESSKKGGIKLCRVPGCSKQSQGLPKDYMCARHFNQKNAGVDLGIDDEGQREEEEWSCRKCHTTNEPKRKRCSFCRGWKCGKRSLVQRDFSNDSTQSEDVIAPGEQEIRTNLTEPDQQQLAGETAHVSMGDDEGIENNDDGVGTGDEAAEQNGTRRKHTSKDANSLNSNGVTVVDSLELDPPQDGATGMAVIDDTDSNARAAKRTKIFYVAEASEPSTKIVSRSHQNGGSEIFEVAEESEPSTKIVSRSHQNGGSEIFEVAEESEPSTKIVSRSHQNGGSSKKRRESDNRSPVEHPTCEENDDDDDHDSFSDVPSTPPSGPRYGGLCAISGCPKYSQGTRTNFMCKRHFKDPSAPVIQETPKKKAKAGKKANRSTGTKKAKKRCAPEKGTPVSVRKRCRRSPRSSISPTIAIPSPSNSPPSRRRSPSGTAMHSVAGQRKEPAIETKIRQSASPAYATSQKGHGDVWRRRREAAVPAPDFGEGWMMAEIKRAKGSKVASDKYWWSPDGKRFRSRPEVQRYLKSSQNGITAGVQDSVDQPSQGTPLEDSKKEIIDDAEDQELTCQQHQNDDSALSVNKMPSTLVASASSGPSRRAGSAAAANGLDGLSSPANEELLQNSQPSLSQPSRLSSNDAEGNELTRQQQGDISTVAASAINEASTSTSLASSKPSQQTDREAAANEPGGLSSTGNEEQSQNSQHSRLSPQQQGDTIVAITVNEASKLVPSATSRPSQRTSRAVSNGLDGNEHLSHSSGVVCIENKNLSLQQQGDTTTVAACSPNESKPSQQTDSAAAANEPGGLSSTGNEEQFQNSQHAHSSSEVTDIEGKNPSPQHQGDTITVVASAPNQVSMPILSASSRPSRRASRAAANGINSLACKPKSKEDMTSQALAYTAPFGNADIPRYSSPVMAGLSTDIIRQMLDDNDIDDERTPGTIIRSLPGSDFDSKNPRHRSIFCHLFRNFYGEIDLLENRSGKNLPLSRRERDIIVYCIAEKKDAEFCRRFLPYRKSVEGDIERLYNAIEEKGFHKDLDHVAHVRKLVGEIVRLEEGQGIMNLSRKKSACIRGEGADQATSRVSISSDLTAMLIQGLT